MQLSVIIIGVYGIISAQCRDEEKISKACYWPNEVYEPCFGGCAEVSCDNPRTHLRPCYPYCEPGCVCEDPYVRDDRTHQCVLPQDCSPTQMGIPVPPKRQAQAAPAFTVNLPNIQNTPNIPNIPNIPRSHTRREDAVEINQAEIMNNNHMEDMKKSPDLARMGNYFNIVIAPPPIKALQPRKFLSNGDMQLQSKQIM